MLGLCLLLAGCERQPTEPPAVNVRTEAPSPPAARAPVVPTPPPALSRADLVSAAAQAASAFAEGRTAASADPLVGRPFSVRLPFGCTGPIPAAAQADDRDGVAGWTWGPDRKSIQLRMNPGEWSASALIAASGATSWEAVEGFWIPRPWLASEACPAVRDDPRQEGVVSASPQTVGLAAVFEAGGSRIGRRNGRAYEFAVRRKGDEPLVPPESGYRMLLEGRIAAFPNGQAVACGAPGPNQRPVCIIAVKLDRVAFEDAGDGILSEWRPG